MKLKIQKFLLAVLFLLSMIQVQATAQTEINTKFSKLSKICLPQISLYAKSNTLDNLMFDYYLIIPQEDHFKTGNVFVGFRLKSQPETLWLYNGAGIWSKYDSTNAPLAFSTDAYDQLELQPVTRTSISNYPIDISSYVGDGELWVGYGFRSSGGMTAQESFDEMIDSERFKLIWEIGQPPGLISGKFADISAICISITEMTQIIPPDFYSISVLDSTPAQNTFQ